MTTVRPARLVDASSLAAVSIEVWVGTYLREGISPFFADFVLSDLTTEKFEAILNNANEHVFVSENTVGIDGYVRVSEGCSAECGDCSDTEVATLYVQPRHHGTGVGQRLLETALEVCRQKDALCPWLMVNSENTRAIAFYKRNGFTIVGQTEFQIADQGYLNEVMSIDLA